MKLNEGAFFAILFVCLTILALGSISLDYWNTNQVRVTYQTAYQKNMECRIANTTVKGGVVSSEFVDKVCGKIPTWEDYQKMTELNPLKWQEIFGQLVEEGHYDVGSVNYYHLTSILEDLYVENQELKSRVETLEKDMELIKSYAWEK